MPWLWIAPEIELHEVVTGLCAAFAFERLASRRRQEAKLPSSSANHLFPVAWTAPLAHSNPKNRRTRPSRDASLVKERTCLSGASIECASVASRYDRRPALAEPIFALAGRPRSCPGLLQCVSVQSHDTYPEADNRLAIRTSQNSSIVLAECDRSARIGCECTYSSRSVFFRFPNPVASSSRKRRFHKKRPILTPSLSDDSFG